jgi:hypothetical protein
MNANIATETLYIAPRSRPADRDAATGDWTTNSFDSYAEAEKAASSMDETCPLDGADDWWVVCFRGRASAGGVVTDFAAQAAFDTIAVEDVAVQEADEGLLRVTATVTARDFRGSVTFSAIPADERTRMGIAPAGDDTSAWMDGKLYESMGHKRAVETGLEVLARANRVPVTPRGPTLGEQIAELAEASRGLWEMAVETCVTPDNKPIHAKRRAAQRAASAAETALGGVEDAVNAGDIARALEHAEEARTLAREWGDDSNERQILALLGAQG